jgi:predicted PurR-regulated permease PerM
MFRKTSAPEAVLVPASPTFWSDGFGRIAIRVLQSLIVLTAVVIVVYAAVQLKLVVIPVLIALIVASALQPLMRALVKVMPRSLAAVLSLLAGVILFGGIITFAVVQVQSQYSALQKSVSNGIDQVGDFITNGPIDISAAQIESARKALIGFVTSAQFGSGALAGVSAAVSLITGVVLAVIVLFYFLKDGPQIWAFLISPFNPELHAKARRAGDSAVQSLGGYVRGTSIVAFVDALFIGIAMVILRVPLAIPLAIVVFIGAFIPLVGATVAGVIAALVTLVTVDLSSAIVVAIVVIVVQQLEGNFLSPVVLGRSLKLHGLVVLLALTVGTILGGIVGTLLSVPTAAVAWAVIKQWNVPIVPTPGLDFPRQAREAQAQETKTRRSDG